MWKVKVVADYYRFQVIATLIFSMISFDDPFMIDIINFFITDDLGYFAPCLYKAT